MKKYIKRIWFTVTIPLVSVVVSSVVVSVIGLPLEMWPNIWRGKYDHEPWDFWNH